LERMNECWNLGEKGVNFDDAKNARKWMEKREVARMGNNGTKDDGIYLILFGIIFMMRK
jgi:hypothetical protein